MKMQHHSGHGQRRFVKSRVCRAAVESLESRRLLSAYGLAPLYKFGNGTDGGEPYSPLTAFNGLLYGTTYTGGADGAGNIFSVNPTNNHITTSVATFNNTNGYAPANCALTVVGQNLYIASSGSITQPSKISVFNPASGSLSLFASFPAPATNATPEIVETMLDVGGNLYGVASRDVAHQNQCYIFECNVTTKAITPLAYYDDSFPSPLLDYNGSLYGTEANGIYQYNLTTKAFKVFPVVSEPLINGYYSGLTNVSGMFYSTDYSGGSSGDGSLFQFDPVTGKLTTLASFTDADAGPLGNMTYANGNLYGTTLGVHSEDNSAAFEYNIAAKTLTTIAEFDSIGQGAPTSGLVDVNGALYGTSTFGDNYQGWGVVFALVPSATIQLFPTLNNITLRVDPSHSNNVEVLNGTTQYEEIYGAPPSITVKGDSATSNSVTIDYKSGGFFDSTVSFLGAGSNNSLSILDAASPTSHNWNVDTNNIMAVGGDWSANPTVDYNAVQHVSLTTRSAGDETIAVKNAALSGQTLPSSITLHITTNVAVDIKQTASPITIDGTGSASSTLEGVTIGSDAPSLGGTLAGIMAPITVNNVSELIVDDSGDTANRTGTISPSSITGFGLPGSNAINYSAVGALTLHGGSGENTDTVTGTSATTTLYPGTSGGSDVYVKATTAALTINGNDKVDYITVGSLAPSLGGTLAKIAGSITVTNTSAYSTITLDDSGDKTNRTGKISPTAVTGFGMGASAALNYTGSQLMSLTVSGGSGQNTDTITGTSAPTTLYPGAADACTVDVRAATAALTINGNKKVDYITIGSLAPTLGGTLSAIMGPMTVTNTSANSTLALDDSGDNTSRTGTLTPTHISGLGMGSKAVVNYTGNQLASVTIRGGKKGGTLTETGTSTTTNVIGMTVKA